MSVLQSQPSLSISTNQCKQKFLINEIQSMKVTKDIYCGIFDQLKGILKRVSTMGQTSKFQEGKEQKGTNQCDTTNESHNASLSIEQDHFHHIFTSSPNSNHSKSITSSHQLKQINTHINKFTTELQGKVKDYCSSSISQNIVKYLQIEKEEHQFYPLIIHQLNTFIKTNQKEITQRQKQLQSIEDQKYHKEHSKKNQKSPKDKSSAQKDKKSTQKTISSFDFNRRVMEVVKKQMNLLKLKKTKLLQQIQQKKIIQVEKQSKKQNSENLHQLRNVYKKQNFTHEVTKSQQLDVKKLLTLKMNNKQTHQQTLTKPQNSKNDTSSFEKIVMIYQKQKFLNSRIQQQIEKLKKKILSQRQQNHLLEEKTSQIQKQIEKLDWTKVCDSSFAPVHHKKIDRPIQLSILDRTFLKPCDQKSIEYSQMSINQSMIRKE